MKKLLLGLCLAMGLGVEAYALDRAECDAFVKSLPADYSAGWVQVPENWSDPEGPKIEVFYYTNRRPEQTPVVFFCGGPLGWEHHSYLEFGPQAEKRGLGFIYIDQRGTGCSTQVTPVTDGPTAVKNSWYTTDQIVQDAEFIRTRLLGPEQKWKVFGQSFGGTITNRYILMKPESILSAHNYAGGFVDDMTSFMTERMLSQQRVAGEFFAQYPGLRPLLAKVRAATTEEDCIFSSDKHRVCGQVLVDSYLETQLGSLRRWKKLTEELPRLLREDGRLNTELLQKNVGWLFDFFFSSSWTNSQLAWFQETRSANPWFDLYEDCDLAYRNIAERGVERSELLTDHCRIVQTAMTPESRAFMRAIMPLVPVRGRQTTESFLAALHSTPSLRYYVYSGGLDFHDVSRSTYRRIANEAQIFYTDFAKNDHFGYFDEVQFWDELARDRE